jgi:hypothetical protein
MKHDQYEDRQYPDWQYADWLPLRGEWLTRFLLLLETTALLLPFALLFGTCGWHSRPNPEALVLTAHAQMQEFAAGIGLYVKDNGQPPTTQQALSALITRPVVPPQLPKWRPYLGTLAVPGDPWGNTYVYQSPGPAGERYVMLRDHLLRGGRNCGRQRPR